MALRLIAFLILLTFEPIGFSNVSRKEAETALIRGISFFHSISIQGGYVYFVTLDLERRWGEGEVDHHTIEVQAPGTPAVGLAYMRAYSATSNEEILVPAKDAADALIRGQNHFGGWQHTIRFDREPGNEVSFDDDQTQTALSFLMALDQKIDEQPLTDAIDRALNLMMESQLSSGGWPHKFPKQGNYHDYATFNDEGINDCVRVMIEAHSNYKLSGIEDSLKKVGRFLIVSQIPPPQPGWAQQYNEFLQPAWARSFEPPSVCPSVTVNNINTLLDLYLHLEKDEYLEPIPDAIRWLRSIRLKNGKWARFVELYTNKPLYYDRGRIRVDSLEELSIERRLGYGYEIELDDKLRQTTERFETIRALGRKAFLLKGEKLPFSASKSVSIDELSIQVEKILSDQDERGRWVTRNDRFKKRVPGALWNGDYEVMDRISSQVFIHNIDTLSKYIQALDSKSR